MKIYFDNVLIDENYYSINPKQSYILFQENETFKLGATPCNSLTFGISKAGAPTNPELCKIEINNVLYGLFNVENIVEEETNLIYTITDNMIKFNFNYDASVLIDNSLHQETDGTKYVLLSELLTDICSKVSIQLEDDNFHGADKHINWYDNTITAREYISMIAELNGGYAIINSSNKLELKQISNTPVKTINFSECEKPKIGELHKYSKVTLDNGLGIFTPVGNDDYNTLYLNSNNVFITEQADLNYIYNIINGLEFFSLEVNKCTIDDNIKTGDCIAFTDGTNTYKTYAQCELEFFCGWIGGYKFVVNSEKQEETAKIIGTNQNIEKIRKAFTEIDRLKNQILLMVQEIGDNGQITAASIILAINNDTSGATIDADVINLSANDVLNLLAGNTINLSSKNIVIDSDYLDITSNGVLTLEDNGQNTSNPRLTVKSQNYEFYSYSWGFNIKTIFNQANQGITAEFGPQWLKFYKYFEDNNSGYSYFGYATLKIVDTDDNVESEVTANRITTPKIKAGNIDNGTCTLNSSSSVSVSFNKTFSHVPSVILTPNTSASGVIAPKIRSVSKTGFTAILGGSGFSNIDCDWIAIDA